MQIVIDISEEMYEEIIDESGIDTMVIPFRDIIKNGTPLPKGHGDLVDISPYKGKVICSHLYNGVKKLIEVDSIEPIIEADKGE